MATIWGILTALAPIIAPIVSLVLVVIGRIIWNHETRLRDLERSATRHGRTLYGDDDDYQQDGLSQDITSIVERLDRVEQKIDGLRRDIEDE